MVSFMTFSQSITGSLMFCFLDIKNLFLFSLKLYLIIELDYIFVSKNEAIIFFLLPDPSIMQKLWQYSYVH